jgi:hypothetical protein
VTVACHPVVILSFPPPPLIQLVCCSVYSPRVFVKDPRSYMASLDFGIDDISGFSPCWV